MQMYECADYCSNHVHDTDGFAVTVVAVIAAVDVNVANVVVTDKPPAVAGAHIALKRNIEINKKKKKKSYRFNYDLP